jgi:hypothetical protein
MSYRSVYCISPSHLQAHRVIFRLTGPEFPPADTSALFIDPEKDDRSSSGGAYKNSPSRKTPSSAYPELGPPSSRQITVIPKLGRLIAFGPVAAFSSAVSSYGIAGGLREFGVPGSEAVRYEARLKLGHVFLSLRSENPDISDRVRQIFNAEGAEDVCTLMDIIPLKIPRRRAYGVARVH